MTITISNMSRTRLKASIKQSVPVQTTIVHAEYGPRAGSIWYDSIKNSKELLTVCTEEAKLENWTDWERIKSNLVERKVKRVWFTNGKSVLLSAFLKAVKSGSLVLVGLKMIDPLPSSQIHY